MSAKSLLPADPAVWNGEPLVPRFGDPAHAATDPISTAWWALDISAVRAAIIAAARSSVPVSWIENVFDKILVADVDQNNVHLVGPYAGREQMIGRRITDYWPRESWPVFADLLLATVASHPPGDNRIRHCTSIAFEDCVMGMSAEEGFPDLVFVSVGGRISDPRSLWTVRASEQRYRTLIHYLPVALLQVDSRAMVPIFEDLRCSGVTDIGAHLDANPELALHSRDIVRVTDANLKLLQMIGAEHVDQLIGAVDFVFAASPETATRVITAHFEGRRSYTEVMKLRTFDGRLRDVELYVTYPTPPERLDITILSLEDITERLRTAAQLRELQADYSRAARISMLGELATSIAHEVNQPLSAIVTNAETSLRWLSRPELNLDKIRQLTTRIAGSGRHASEIVQRIRGMAAPRAPERRALDINEVAEEALLFVRHETDSRAISLSTSLAPHLPQVLGDRIQLQQVIVNLILNAAQAIGGQMDRRIELCTALDEDGCVTFAVHDSGPGIAPGNLDKIFGSFFTTKEEGMGIGLAICQSIVSAHGGTITAANHPAGGAIFRVSLPATARLDFSSAGKPAGRR